MFQAALGWKFGKPLRALPQSFHGVDLENVSLLATLFIWGVLQSPRVDWSHALSQRGA